MQPWEYLSVIVHHSGGHLYDDNSAIVTQINGNNMAEWKGGLFGGLSGSNFLEILSQLGEEGWDMVNFAKISDYQIKYLFKRPT